jgi:hypothetical protein
MLFIINEVSYIFVRIYKHTGFCVRARGARRPYFYRIIFPQTIAYFYLFIFSIFFFFFTVFTIFIRSHVGCAECGICGTGGGVIEREQTGYTDYTVIQCTRAYIRAYVLYTVHIRTKRTTLIRE